MYFSFCYVLIIYLLKYTFFYLTQEVGNQKTISRNYVIPSKDNFTAGEKYSDNFRNDHRHNVNSADDVERQVNKEIKRLKKTNTEDEELIGLIKNDEVIEKEINIPTPEHSFNVNSFLGNLKNSFEIGSGIFMTGLEKLTKEFNSEYPFEKGTSLHNFYCKVFPFVKLLSFIVLCIVLYFSISGMINLLIKKEELGKSSKNEDITIMNPFIGILKEEKEIGISLRGRKIRLPKPINYKELFNSSDNNPSSISNSNTQILEEIKKENNVDENYCDIEDFFAKVNFIQKFNLNEKESSQVLIQPSENLLLFNDEPKIIADKKVENIREDEVLDDHTQLMNRLRSTSKIQKTVITGFSIRK